MINRFAYILFYIALIWLAHLMVWGIVTFFHLQLGYSFNMIQEWVFDNSYQVVILCKLAAMIPLVTWASLWNKERWPIRKMIRNGLEFDQRNIGLVVLFCAIFFGFFFQFEGIKHIRSYHLLLIITYLFGAIEVLIDCFFFYVLCSSFPMSKSKNVFFALIFAFCLYTVEHNVFDFAENLESSRVSMFLLLNLFVIYRKENWVSPVIFYSLFIGIIFTFFGLGPYLGATYTPYQVVGNQIQSLSHILYLVPSLYIIFFILNDSKRSQV